MLLGRYSVMQKGPGRWFGGSTVADAPSNIGKSGAARNMFAGDQGNGLRPTCAVPDGYRPPGCWVLAQNDGGIASHTQIQAPATLAGNIAGGIGAAATLSGSGNITNAALGLIVSAVATLIGSGAFTASVNGRLLAAATISATGGLTGGIVALANVIATITGTGTFSPTVAASGDMASTITSFGTLSPENLASAVWNALATSFNGAGTMGERLNGAASAGDPWGTALPGSYVEGTAGFKLGTLSAAVSGTAAVSTLAIGRTLNVGIETNDYTDTRSANGVHHTIDDVSNNIDIEYQFSVGVDGIPVGLTMTSNLQSGNDSLDVLAWNWITAGWDQVGTHPGSGSAALAVRDFPLQTGHVGMGGDAGSVRVRFQGGSSNPRFDVDYLYISYAVVTRSAQFVGTAAGGSSTTVVFPAGASSLDDYYRPGLVVLTSGTGAGQSRRIDGYTGATRVTTVATPWVTAPDATTGFSVVPWGTVRVSDLDAGPLADIAAVVVGTGLTSTQATQMLELYRLAGLDPTRPLIVTSTSRDAGAGIEQDIVEAPAGTITVTRQ